MTELWRAKLLHISKQMLWCLLQKMYRIFFICLFISIFIYLPNCLVNMQYTFSSLTHTYKCASRQLVSGSIYRCVGCLISSIKIVPEDSLLLKLIFVLLNRYFHIHKTVQLTLIFGIFIFFFLYNLYWRKGKGCSILMLLCSRHYSSEISYSKNVILFLWDLGHVLSLEQMLVPNLSFRWAWTRLNQSHLPLSGNPRGTREAILV